MDTDLIARLGRVTNLTHGFIYFSPDATERYEAVGLAPVHHYFASRAAAMGPVGPELVVATFFNFSPHAVARAIPAAWDFASAEAVQRARMAAAGATLQRLGGAIDPDTVAEATTLAGRMLDGLGDEGTPLAAANRTVPEPDEAWSRLWQRITVLREWRGDAHVAVLTSAPLTAVEALVLHAATGQVPRDALLSTRGWSDDAWAAAVERLAHRGLVEVDGSFTEEGAEYREALEHRTDRACAAMVDAVGADDARRLVDLLRPIGSALIEGGAFAALGR